MPGGQPLRALHVQGEIPVAEAEPGRAAEFSERLHERPGLVATAPAEFEVGNSGERVERGVEVRADPEPQMIEVIATVDDDAQAVRGQHPVQAERQLRPADAATDGHHPRHQQNRS